MSLLQRNFSNHKKSYKSSLSIKIKTERRSFSAKSQSEICLNKNLYKKEINIYNEDLLILNYIINCSQKKFSAKTALSDTVFKNLEYDYNMYNKYDEKLNSNLSFISNFDLEGDNNANNNSFNSENDEDSFETIDIKNKYDKAILNNIDKDDEINDKLNKDFLDLKHLLLGNNVKNIKTFYK